uniref:Uncharacterized protein n=1 Tax=Rhodnius prolixus TaxID=13249 RepID=T1HB16_RHOPR
MIARMRVRESYRIAKAIRQNKIKSKKYHRILKKERIKKELKDFEILQKTNPEAALEKLDKIERARAEERISLRHRNTGKWAKSRAIRAKYDTEARAQLAEQLAKSRDLTRRVQASTDSTSEDDDDGNEAGKESLLTDPTNPWKSVAESAETEIESFVEGFKQYEEEKKNETVQNNAINATENRALPKDISNVTCSSVQDGDAFDSEKPENLDCAESSNEETSIRQCFSESKNLGNEDDLNLREENSSDVNQRANNLNTPPATQIFAADDIESLNACSDEVGSVTLKNSDGEKTALRGMEENKISAQLSTENKTTLQLQQKLTPSNKSKTKAEPEATGNSFVKKIIFSNIEITNRTNENVTINLRQRTPKIISSEYEFQNNGSESGITLINKTKKSKLQKQLNLVNQSGTWEVSSVDASKQNSIETFNNEINSIHKISTIDKIFDNAEHKLKSTLSNHVTELKSNLTNENDNSEKIKKSKYHVDLSMKSRGKKSDIDTTLIEVANEGISTGENDLKTLLNLYDTNKNITKNEVTNIDPHKFLPVKPQKLNSGQLDFVEEHNESEDEELIDINRKLNLEEAFADDDVIEEFRREKEKDIERSNPKDIDLTLPGWGHWAGCSMEQTAENRRKRKNRRLIIKFPKIPRKDDKKDYVIINEDVSNNLKKHMVHDLPFPFKSVKDYETSIRAPIGNTWVPQSAFMKFIQPSVLTRLGSIIEPMSETERSNFKKRKVQKK